jgi:hypothetical protein
VPVSFIAYLTNIELILNLSYPLIIIAGASGGGKSCFMANLFINAVPNRDHAILHLVSIAA